jgi:hypothetical protein
VALLPGAPVRFIHIGHDINEASSWTLQHLDPAPGCIGALAYQGAARHVVMHPPQHPQDFLDHFAF